MCKNDNCKKRAIYNFEGFKAEYCGRCKDPKMVNVKNKTCIHPECKTRPVYNKEGELKALYCSTHKTEGMLNVKSKTCIHNSCKKIPTYNTEGKYVLYSAPDRIRAGYLKYIRENYWLMENISAPIRAISAYKLQDLVDICAKLNLPVAVSIPGKFGSMGTEKRKTKPELYEAICKCV